MFRSRIVQLGRQQVRYNSTAAKAQNAASSIVGKVTGLVSSTVYWSKVTAELAKQVYLKEGFAPPSLHNFQTVYTELWTSLLNISTKPQSTLEGLKHVSTNDLYKYGIYGVQILGLFSLGEIIGRRHVVGYAHHK